MMGPNWQPRLAIKKSSAQRTLKWQTKEAKKANNTRSSQAVSHPSTILAQCCLTSVIGRELVYSTWYGRWREMREKRLLLSTNKCHASRPRALCTLLSNLLWPSNNLALSQVATDPFADLIDASHRKFYQGMNESFTISINNRQPAKITRRLQKKWSHRTKLDGAV